MQTWLPRFNGVLGYRPDRSFSGYRYRLRRQAAVDFRDSSQQADDFHRLARDSLGVGFKPKAAVYITA